MSEILKLIDVNKRFGGVITAENVCMEVEEGQIVGLIGPNGAGKTTLLNLISGILPVDSGTIEFLGQDITILPSHKRASMGIARTFQTPRLLQRSNIRENLLIADDLGKGRSFIESIFDQTSPNYLDELNKLTKVAGFKFYLEDPITSLTFGQRKLLEIIRSILTNPKLILVDEPAAGLNSAEIENAVKLLHLASKERGISIILIEHSMDMVMNICSKITVLNFGKVIGCGSPEEISNNEEVITAYLGRNRDVRD